MSSPLFRDHYDVYAFTVFSPLGIASSFFLIASILFFENSRKSPGNFLIVIFTLELIAFLHSFLTDFDLPKLMAQKDNVLKFTFLGRTIIEIFPTAKSLFEMSFSLALISLFNRKNAKSRDHPLLWLLPIAISVFLWTFKECMADKTHKNQTFQDEHLDFIQFNICMLNLLFVFGAWISLKRAIKYHKNHIGVRDDFYDFYKNICEIFFAENLLKAIRYYFIMTIDNCLETKPILINVCYNWFYISKIGLDWESFFPFLILLAKVYDPLTKKLFKITVEDFKPKESGIKCSSLMDSLIINKDAEDSHEIRELHEKMVRSIITGIELYFKNWINVYRQINDQSAQDKIINVLDHNHVHSAQDLNIGLENSIYECEIGSINSKEIIKIIDLFMIIDIQKSFNPSLSDVQVKTYSDAKTDEWLLDFITWDHRFRVKTISKEEFSNVKNNFNEYSSYVCSNKFTFLAKTVGIFKFKFLTSSKTVRIIVTENPLMDQNQILHRCYDLKGFHYNRQVLVKSDADLQRIKKRKINEILMDIDFMNLERSISLKKTDWDFIFDNVRRDIDFLSGLNLIDYSLKLGVCEVNRLNEEQLRQLEELVQVKLAFYELSKNLAIVLGISELSKIYNLKVKAKRIAAMVSGKEVQFQTDLQTPSVFANRIKESMEENFRF